MRLRRSATLALATTATAFLVAGCGEDDASEPAAPDSGGTEVTIETFMYEPDPLEVEAGTTVRFVNEDDILHTVTEGSKGDLVEGGFDLRLDGEGTDGEVEFDKPGSVDYTCTVHQGMDGSVEVR